MSGYKAEQSKLLGRAKIPANNRMQPNAYRPVFQPHFASEQAISWKESCWPGIG